MLKKYNNLKEIYQANLNSTDKEVLVDYILLFKEVWFDEETRTLLIDTPILSYRQDIFRDERIFKIRILKEYERTKSNTTKA